MSAVEESEVSISVPADTADDYTFTVQATNAFGKTGSFSKVVTISNDESLTISFGISSDVTIKSAQRLRVKPSVMSDCGTAINPRYEWSFQGTVSGDEATVSTNSESILILEENQLAADEGYIFRCTATQSTYQGSEDADRSLQLW